MQIDVLVIPGCPNSEIAMSRIHTAITRAAIPTPTVTRHVITDLPQAQAHGMCGSPTILLNGHDPFAYPGASPSLSCRLYPREHGTQGCPTEDELINALRRADQT
ncbi:MAG: hypothetical protein AB7W59_08270 [Acidimicrobiia bacterium]